MATETSYADLKESSGVLETSQQPNDSPLAEDDVSLLDWLILLAERKRTIIFITVACGVVALVTSLLLPKWYTATVVLLPPQQNSSLGSALSSLNNLTSMAVITGGGLSTKNPNDMYIAMLKTQTVEDAMVRDYELQREYHARLVSDARRAFERHAELDGSAKDGLLHISIEDRNPQRAAQLANGYVEHFQRLSQGLAITEASQRRLFFERQMEQAKNNLADAEESLKRTEQTTGLIQLDSQARALIASAASLRAEIAAKEVQIQGMQTYATGENAQLVQSQRELESMRAQLAKLGGSEDSPDSLMVSKGKVTEAGLQYVRKLRDVKYYETIFDILARQFELAKLDEAKEGALVQVVDPAIPPDRKSSPKRVFIVTMATVAGFFLGILIAWIQAFWTRLIENPASGPKIALLRRTLRRNGDPTV